MKIGARLCSMKIMFLQISQNSQGNKCVGVSILIKLHKDSVDFETGVFHYILRNF